ncbi:hypothetical protein T06_5078 [Trichinella sp. T6]|nr:hypothetical protein T06_5078 [Trichinella sp. T6]
MTDSVTVHRWVSDGLSGKARLKTKVSAGSRPCEVRVQQGRRINPRAAAVAEATRGWTGARLCGDCGSGSGVNDRRCPSCQGPSGNKANVVPREVDGSDSFQAPGATALGGGVLRTGAPEVLLTDNDTAFRGRIFTDFIARWGVRVRYRCAYAASGNGIAERCHRSVKVIAARKKCTVEEEMYLYNVTPRDSRNPWTAQANVVHAYAVRVRASDFSEQTADEEEEMIIHLPPRDAEDADLFAEPAPEPAPVGPRRSTRIRRPTACLCCD